MSEITAEGGHFFGVYCAGNTPDARARELTPSRDSIEEVVADLQKAQAQRSIIGFAQIISTATLDPVEPAGATIERLRQTDKASARSRRHSVLSDSMGPETPRIGQSVGYLMLAMTVICLGTVVGVLLVP